jgi:hypothetical protein
VAFIAQRQEALMRTSTEVLEVARHRRDKARCLARDAAGLALPEDRARVIQYAKFLEEEAIKLEAQAEQGLF